MSVFEVMFDVGDMDEEEIKNYFKAFTDEDTSTYFGFNAKITWNYCYFVVGGHSTRCVLALVSQAYRKSTDEDNTDKLKRYLKFMKHNNNEIDACKYEAPTLMTCRLISCEEVDLS